jgi:hypothetical protein
MTRRINHLSRTALIQSTIASRKGEVSSRRRRKKYKIPFCKA